MTISSLFSGFDSTLAGILSLRAGHLTWLLIALFFACGFEFINGFHDTANAVATVIYTRSLKPWQAVTLSGIFNFLGVFLGGIAVAMGVVKLLPTELITGHQFGASMAMVFSLLSAAIIWNLGTWFLGLPASSSHTLIGAILGIGLANAYLVGKPISSGVNWGKAAEIGMALLISPAIGFVCGALLLLFSKKFLNHPEFQRAPKPGQTPPWQIRTLLIGTSSGVSLVHGSNDGQKGVGLIMLILISILPGQFAIRGSITPNEFHEAALASKRITTALHSPALNPAMLGADQIRVAQSTSEHLLPLVPSAQAQATDEPTAMAAAAETAQQIDSKFESSGSLDNLSPSDRSEARTLILQLDQMLGKIEKSGTVATKSPEWAALQKDRARLKSLTEYAPTWVLLMVALSIGLGTMVGWKRIVVTVGEKIGKSHLTYAQGATAELVAMSTIGLSAYAGLPVSTTHVLSSGIAGTMVAGKSGLQAKTVKNIGLAWLLTLPVSMTLSATLFVVFHRIFA